MFTAGPSALTLYSVDMDLTTATTASDPWTTWRKDAGTGTLTNSSWSQLQSLEWTAERCRLPADFIQVDRLSFEIWSGTARLTVRALNVPSRKYLIARLQPQGLGTGTVSCTLEILDVNGAVVLRREAPCRRTSPAMSGSTTEACRKEPMSAGPPPTGQGRFSLRDRRRSTIWKTRPGRSPGQAWTRSGSSNRGHPWSPAKSR